MVIGNHIGQMMGRRMGSFLGKQLALGACREDREDDLARRTFRSPMRGARLPAAVDLRPWMTPVEDQGQLGSCAANALVGGVEYLHRRETGQHVDLSRLFVYFCQRLYDDNVRDDLGASLGDGVRVLSRLGVPTERLWPYRRQLFAVQPPRPVCREARALRIVDWWNVPVDPSAFRGCLAAGFPIAFGTKVTESFVRTPRTGICGMPRGRDDARHGRHALLAVGYDDAARIFVVRNSWGAAWGDAGYCYMPYDYVLNRAWTRNCWALRLTRRDAFDPDRHGGVDLRSVPSAPPGGGAGGTGRAIGTAGSMAAQVAIGAFTGSGLLAGLAGGLIAGVAPGVTKAVAGRDRGAFVGEDLSETILAVMASTPDDASIGRLGFDDGIDEEAQVDRVSRASAGRRVRTAPRHGSAGDDGPPRERAPEDTAPRAKGAASAAGAIAAIASAAGGARAPTELKIAPRPAPRRRPPPPAPPKVDPAIEAALPPHIETWWRRDGGPKGPLGFPVALPERMSEGAYHGSFVRFADGAMLAWDPPPGAPPADPIVLHDRAPTVALWFASGEEESALGWPVDEPEDVGRSTELKCVRGSIVDHPEHGTHAVTGSLFVHWRSLGGLAGELGPPTAEAQIPADPRGRQRQTFEGGTLTWSPEEGGRRQAE